MKRSVTLLIIFFLSLSLASGLNPEDYKENIVWDGKVLDLYPMNMEYDKKTSDIIFKADKVSKDGYLFKYPKANNIEIFKDGINLWKITTGATPYQVEDIRETKEWAYNTVGYKTDSIKAKGNLIRKGEYICIDEKKVYGSGLSKKTVYEECLYYPQKSINVSGSFCANSDCSYLRNWSYVPSTTYNINKDTATITYLTPYDPLTSNLTIGLISCYDFGTENDTSDEWGSNDFAIHGATWISANNGSYLFDADADKLNISGTFGSPSDATVYSVFSVESFDTQSSAIISIADRLGLRVEDSPQEVYGFFYRGGSVWSNTAYATTIQGVGYRNLAYVFNDSDNSQEVYFEGVQRNTDSQSNSIDWSGNSGYTNIGEHADGFALQSFFGNISFVAIWSVELNSTQISQLDSLGDDITCEEIIASGNTSNSQPTSEIYYPIDNNTYNRVWMNFSLYGSDNENSTLNTTLYINDTLNHTNNSYSNATTWIFNTTIGYGSYKAIFEVCDTHTTPSCTNSSEIRFNLTAPTPPPNNPPISFIDYPLNSSSFNRSWMNFSLRATDNDNSSLTLKLYVNGSSQTNLSVNNNTNWFYNWSLGYGYWRAVLEASDGINISNSTPTFFSLICVSSFANITGAWANTSLCRINDTYSQTRNITQYDTNFCPGSINTTFVENRSQSCDYCSINIVNNPFNAWSDPAGSCGTRNRTYYDSNYTTCCRITNISGDCLNGTLANTSIRQDNFTISYNFTEYDTASCVTVGIAGIVSMIIILMAVSIMSMIAVFTNDRKITDVGNITTLILSIITILVGIMVVAVTL